MSIKLTIHSIDIENRNAIITLIDDGHLLINKKNLTISLNDDGTSANTTWLNEYVKNYAFVERLLRVEKAQTDII